MYAKSQYLLAALLCLAGRATAGPRPGSRIVGGATAEIVDMPYVVSLMTYGFHSCGGSIVNERTVLTAAHCLAFARPGVMRVQVGSQTRGLGGGQLVPVAAIHSHERWNTEDMDFDIGLVRLSRALRYSRAVRPIRLPGGAGELRDGSLGTIAGWGLTTADGVGSNVLRYARVPVVNRELCNQLLGGAVSERMFCAGYLRGGVDACQMDSGGPLAIDDKLEGLVSWGIGCALPNKPGVYTRVSALRPWVERIMASEYNERLE